MINDVVTQPTIYFFFIIQWPKRTALDLARIGFVKVVYYYCSVACIFDAASISWNEARKCNLHSILSPQNERDAKEWDFITWLENRPKKSHFSNNSDEEILALG